MNTFPKSLADLCGVMLEASAPKRTHTEAPQRDNPIALTKEDDGTFTLTYFGKTVGWIRKERGVKLWRAMSVHGRIIHRASLDGARKALLEAYH